MSKASRYFQTEWLEWFQGINVPAAPANVYLGLFSSDPTDLNTGTEVSSVITGGVRPEITFAAPVSASANGLSISNDDALIYTSGSAGNANVTHGAIFDADTAGNMLQHFQFVQAVAVSTGDPVVFGQGRINLISSNAFSQYMITMMMNWIRGIDAPTAPANIYLAPYNTNPGFNNTGTEITNTAFGTADRPIIDMGNQVNDTTSSRITNTQAYNYGNVVNNVGIFHLAWFDAITGGNMLAYGALNTNVSLFTGEPFIIGNGKVGFGIA